MSICKNCNAPLTKQWAKKFCSHSCSATFNNTAKGKKPEKAKRWVKATGEYTKIYYLTCSICSNQVWKPISKKVCSDACFLEAKRRCRRGKVHVYNGIKMDSGWEVELAQHLDQVGIKWIRPTEGMIWIDNKGKEHRYFPDFYLPDRDLYLDPKNRFAVEKQSEKLAYIAKHYPNVKWGDVGDLKIG